MLIKCEVCSSGKLVKPSMFVIVSYGTFCHSVHKLDLSTLFTTFFLWTYLPFIYLHCLQHYFPKHLFNLYIHKDFNMITNELKRCSKKTNGVNNMEKSCLWVKNTHSTMAQQTVRKTTLFVCFRRFISPFLFITA